MILEELDEDEDDTWYCWEEQDWSENKLFYEYVLGYLEELCQREPMKMKERV